MKKDWGSTVNQVHKALEELGPMTRIEICAQLGLDRNLVSAVISRMSRAGALVPKRLYVERYVYDSEHGRHYPRAVYAIGDKPDAKKPKRDQRAVRKRYRERLRSQMTMNSVFNLGLTRRQYEAIKRGKIEQHEEDQQPG